VFGVIDHLRISLQEMFNQRPRYLDQYEVALSMSYMEIYKDDVYDLLVTRENVGIVYAIGAFSDNLDFALGSETACARERCGPSICRQPFFRADLVL
jgi:hypothetical protein